MKRISKEIKLGATFLISLSLLYIGVNFLKGSSILSNKSTYYVVYNHVSGLTPSAVITSNGYQVGKVKQIAYNYTTPDNILVTLHIDKQLQIPKGSRACLKSELLGGVSIELQLTHSNQYYVEDDTLDSGSAHGLMGEIETVMLPQINAIIPQIDSLIATLHHIVSNPAIAKSLDNVEELTSKLTTTTNEINYLFHNELPNIMVHLNETSENLADITQGLNSIDYQQTMTRIDTTIANLQLLSTALSSNNGNIGRLLNDTAFYSNLNKVCDNANALIEDVKHNPSRYINISVFGKK